MRRWPPAAMPAPSSGCIATRAPGLQPGPADAERRRRRRGDPGRLRPGLAEAGDVSGRVRLRHLAAPAGGQRDPGPARDPGTRRKRYLEGDAALETIPTRRPATDVAMDFESPASGCPTGREKSSCCTMSRATGTRRSGRCSDWPPGPRNPSCTGPAWPCASSSSDRGRDHERSLDGTTVGIPGRGVGGRLTGRPRGAPRNLQ